MDFEERMEAKKVSEDEKFVVYRYGHLNSRKKMTSLSPLLLPLISKSSASSLEYDMSWHLTLTLLPVKPLDSTAMVKRRSDDSVKYLEMQRSMNSIRIPFMIHHWQNRQKRHSL